MKRLLLICTVSVLLTSCFSNSYSLIVDAKSPSNQNTTIISKYDESAGWVFYKKWNGVDIRERLYGKETAPFFTPQETVLVVPAGPGTLTADIYFFDKERDTTNSYYLSDVELQYNFEAGEKYTILCKVLKQDSLFDIIDLFSRKTPTVDLVVAIDYKSRSYKTALEWKKVGEKEKI